MALPELIEIVPPDKPVTAEITVPGSKSITNRALILAALGKGKTTLSGALWSEDTQIMVEALAKLGFETDVKPDPAESGNRFITVKGTDGKIPSSGSDQRPLELFVGNAGTAARFLTPLLCLGQGTYRLHGVPRMHERPQAALFRALRQLGYRLEAANDRLPVVITGEGAKQAKCRVSIEESSQFASGLLLCARHGSWEVEVTGENAEESPYVAMTVKLIETFPRAGGAFQIEPDASSGSYFWAAMSRLIRPEAEIEGVKPAVKCWPRSGWQIDARFPDFLPGMTGLPATVRMAGDGARTGLKISRRDDLGDSIMTLIALAPLASGPVYFTDLGRLRFQECERVAALRTELGKCGAKVSENGDILEIQPSAIHGAEIETYNDHRMAMCFAVLGLRVPGIKLRGAACVKKTFPNFFQKLATSAPQGLEATILDAGTRRRLGLGELFAE
jgi:3-phosphoshikimate 1-carboxyvinyltransferase